MAGKITSSQWRGLRGQSKNQKFEPKPLQPAGLRRAWKLTEKQGKRVIEKGQKSHDK